VEASKSKKYNIRPVIGSRVWIPEFRAEGFTILAFG
jgi:hypothetical protein